MGDYLFEILHPREKTSAYISLVYRYFHDKCSEKDKYLHSTITKLHNSDSPCHVHNFRASTLPSYSIHKERNPLLGARMMKGYSLNRYIGFNSRVNRYLSCISSLYTHLTCSRYAITINAFNKSLPCVPLGRCIDWKTIKI